MNSPCVGVGGWDGRWGDMDAEWCRLCLGSSGRGPWGLKEVYRRMWDLQGHRHKSEGALSGL